MTRLAACFDALRAARRKALVAYLCVGDPSLDESVELALAAVSAGADVLELGVPFSDPTADGPTIARAAGRAIRAGATITAVIDVARRVRARCDAPLVLFSYYNPILITGETEAVARASAAGIDAILVVDLPPEESTSLRRAAETAGVAIVSLLTPTSDERRISAVLAAVGAAKGAPPGFLYYVSMTGVTGSAAPELVAARDAAKVLSQRMDTPVVVGFGIDGGSAAREAAGPFGEGPDGIVVGTALVKAIERGASPGERIAGVKGLVSELRRALDAPA
jgi:tryptophan synthase alpha chain